MHFLEGMNSQVQVFITALASVRVLIDLWAKVLMHALLQNRQYHLDSTYTTTVLTHAEDAHRPERHWVVWQPMSDVHATKGWEQLQLQELQVNHVSHAR
jgi:hypothetical protein